VLLATDPLSVVGVLRPGLVAGEQAQVTRLRRFQAGHPDVVIGPGGFGTWQARIPEELGETVTTRYTLREQGQAGRADLGRRRAGRRAQLKGARESRL
jgi:hypothetical protein